jgi:hypothetical protein
MFTPTLQKQTKTINHGRKDLEKSVTFCLKLWLKTNIQDSLCLSVCVRVENNIPGISVPFFVRLPAPPVLWNSLVTAERIPLG